MHHGIQLSMGMTRMGLVRPPYVIVESGGDIITGRNRLPK